MPVNKSLTGGAGSNQAGGRPAKDTTGARQAVHQDQSVQRLLTNVTYTARSRIRYEVHEGEHSAIVADDIWQRVQALLQRNGRTGGAPVRNKFGALLKGILRCVPCNCAMSPTHSTHKGNKRYRYYVCTNAKNAVGTIAHRNRSRPRNRTIRCRPDQVYWQGSGAIERDDRPGQKSGPVNE